LDANGLLLRGNSWQKIASSNFTAAGVDLTFSFTPTDVSPKQNARFYATNLLSELDQPVRENNCLDFNVFHMVCSEPVLAK
jgi:hypothetical protein